VEARLAEKYYRCKGFILLQAFDDLDAGRDSHILPECAGHFFRFNKQKYETTTSAKGPR
jgi:hypothetical protein